jgi:hypothetical protein
MEAWKDGSNKEENGSVVPASNHPTIQLSNHPTIQPCPRTITELFIEGTQPTRTDDWHWRFALDTRNGLLAGAGCSQEFTTQKLYTLYPAEAGDWVRRQGIPQPPQAYSPLCPAESAGLEARKAESVDQPSNHPTIQPRNHPTIQPSNHPSFPLLLTSPDQGSRYQLTPEIPQAVQQINVAVRPASDVALQRVTLLVDGQPLATLTQPPYQVLWPMSVGTHIFTAVGVDVTGTEVQGNRVLIEVVE